MTKWLLVTRILGVGQVTWSRDMNDDPGALPAEASLPDGPAAAGPGPAGPGSAETGPPGTPRRVLFVAWRDLASRRAGGSEVLVDQLASGLLARGHRVTLLCGGPVAGRPYLW